jgi:VWFA-related protein
MKSGASGSNSFLKGLSCLVACAISVCVVMRTRILDGRPDGRKENGQEQSILQVTTRLIEVNLIVQDKKGDPVPDLVRDDFVLLDNGREQQIAVFSMQSSRSLPVKPQLLPSDTYSNRLEPGAGVPDSATVILLDGLNTYFEDQTYARAQLVGFLKTQIRPQDRVALYTLCGNLGTGWV